MERLEKRIDVYIRKYPDDIDGTLIRERILSALNYEKRQGVPLAIPDKTRVVASRFIRWLAEHRIALLARPRTIILLALILIAAGAAALVWRPAAPPLATALPVLSSSSVLALTRGDDKLIYLADRENGQVQVFLASDLQNPFARIPIGSHGNQPGRGTPEQMIGLRRGMLDLIFVTDTASDTVYIIDANYNTVAQQSLKVGTAPRGMAITPDRRRLFVSNEQPIPNGTVKVFDISSNRPGDFHLVASIDKVNCPEGLALSPNGERLYVATQCGGGQDPVFIIDTTSYAKVGQISGLAVGTSVTVSPDSRQLYVGRGNFQCKRSNPDEPGSPLSVVDLTTQTIVNTMCLRTSVGSIALSRDQRQRYLFVANGRNLGVFDRERLSLLNDIPLEADVGGVGVAEDDSVYAHVPGAYKLFVYSPTGLLSE